MASLRQVLGVKNDISLLNNISETDVLALTADSLNYIRHGLSKAALRQHSQSLGANQADIENAITGVAYLLLEIFKHKVSEEDFVALAQELGLQASQRQVIYQFYQNHITELKELISSAKIDSAQFRDLGWRLETQIASRSLQNNLSPRVVLKLGLERFGRRENVALVADLPNIIHFSQTIEQALAEGRNQNSRKIQRILQ